MLKTLAKIRNRERTSKRKAAEAKSCDNYDWLPLTLSGGINEKWKFPNLSNNWKSMGYPKGEKSGLSQVYFNIPQRFEKWFRVSWPLYPYNTEKELDWPKLFKFSVI